MPNDVRKSKPVKAAKKKQDSESPKRPAGDTHGRKPAASRHGSPERPKKIWDKANLHPHLYRYSVSITPPWVHPVTAAQSTVPSPVNQTAFLYPGASSRPVSPDRTEGFLQGKKRAAAPHVTSPHRAAPATARRESVVPLTELPKHTHAVSKKQDEEGAKHWMALREVAQPAETELPAHAPAHTEVQRREVGVAHLRHHNVSGQVSNQEVVCVATFFILQAIGIIVFLYYISSVSGSGDRTEEFEGGSYDDYMEPVYQESGLFASSKYHVLAAANPTNRPLVDHKRLTYKADNHTVLCVFQSRSQHLILNGRQYSASIFPYEYCHIVIYCCLGMDYTVGIFPRQDASFYAFQAMARTNRHVRIRGAVIGDGDQDKGYFERLFEMSPDGKQSTPKFRNDHCNLGQSQRVRTRLRVLPSISGVNRPYFNHRCQVAEKTAQYHLRNSVRAEVKSRVRLVQRGLDDCGAPTRGCPVVASVIQRQSFPMARFNILRWTQHWIYPKLD
ncbi:uncharacterized protein LOC135398289 [Ornithodoros turicata]|uniref:uncharacterized protein LOC135398289 n=1 Tax=Ornithodoros turicata TaxID=34597 RepID=UPI0031396708